MELTRKISPSHRNRNNKSMYYHQYNGQVRRCCCDNSPKVPRPRMFRRTYLLSRRLHRHLSLSLHLLCVLPSLSLVPKVLARSVKKGGITSKPYLSPMKWKVGASSLRWAATLFSENCATMRRTSGGPFATSIQKRVGVLMASARRVGRPNCTPGSSRYYGVLLHQDSHNFPTSDLHITSVSFLSFVLLTVLINAFVLLLTYSFSPHL